MQEEFELMNRIYVNDLEFCGFCQLITKICFLFLEVAGKGE